MIHATHPNGWASSIETRPASPAAPWAISTSGITGRVTSVAGRPTSDTRSKWNATSGSVATVAATVVAADETANCTRGLGESPLSSLAPKTARRRADIGSESVAMPAMAAKLSWNDGAERTPGSTATMTAAASPRAGRTLRGRPSAKAARYTVPMMAARSADGGMPASSAYVHIAARGGTR